MLPSRLHTVVIDFFDFTLPSLDAATLTMINRSMDYELDDFYYKYFFSVVYLFIFFLSTI